MKTSVLCVFVVGAIMVRTAAATTLTEGNLDDGVMGTSDGSFTGSGASSHIFDWTDRDGDGTPGPAVSAGLVMGTLNLDCDTDAYGFRLLNVNGPITYTGAGGALTADYGAHHHDAGDIQITGATDISLSRIDTHHGTTYYAGWISISHSGDLNIAGNVDSSGYYGGYQTFTGGGSSVGHCHIGGNLVGTASARTAYDITIQNYNQVTIDGDIDLLWNSGSHHVYDTAGANIVIQNIGSGGITVSGNMDTSRTASNLGDAGGPVFSTSGDILIEGDITCREKDDAYDAGDAGDIDFDAGTSITILGTIDLDHETAGSREGHAVLTTTGGEGYTIVLGDVDNPGTVTLNFGVINYIQFESSTGESVIYNEISGFSGEGSTQLRVGTAGDKIYYYDDETVNTALRDGGANGVYNIGGSGTLEPIPDPPAGTVIILR